MRTTFLTSTMRAALMMVVAACPLAAQDAGPILVSIQDAMARPGDELLVPVSVSGVEDEIIAGEIGVRFDPGVLTSTGVIRQGALLEDQRWLTASDVIDADGGLSDFRLVYAGASGFAENGDLVFLAFTVNSEAVIGTSTGLEITKASFNNGEPLATLGSGTVSIVEEVLDAGFIGRPRTGQVPLAVRFVDRTVGTVETWAWDFGDGVTSEDENARHEYLSAGTYTVSLTVTGPSGTSTEERRDYITALPDETAPQIIAGPRVRDITNASATVQWRTNEAANSSVEYSTERDLSDSQMVTEADLVDEHEVELSGLEAATAYYYRVQSTDAAGNASRTRDGVFFTRRGADTRAPVITHGPSAEDVTEQSAQIEWRTNEPGTSIVEYAAGDDLNNPTRVESTDLAEEHSVLLEGLQSGTLYAYRVQSIDASNNESRTKSGRFRTRREPDSDPPVILLGPVVIGRTHHAATVKLATNEPASVQVNYGTGTDYGLAETEEERQRLHLIRLTDLEANTLYHYQVEVTNAAGLTTNSADFEFVTRRDADVRPPDFVLRPHVIGRFARSLVILLGSDEPCNVMIEYGADDTYGSVAFSEVEDREHTIVLTDLDEDSEIHYRVSLTDASGNGPVQTDDMRTRTGPEDRDSTPLRILQGPIVSRRAADRLTIEWKTDRPSDSYVDYGTDESRELRSGSSDPTKDHQVTISDLEGGVLYHYAVASTDPEQNTVASDGFTVTTRPAADALSPFFTQAPQNVSVGVDEAHFTFLTDEPTSATAEYGPDLNYGDTELQEEFTTGHRFSIGGLEAGTEYHVRFLVTDASGNGPVPSADIAFATLSAVDTEAPAIIAGPGIIDATSTSVTIAWRTDEPGDSFVDFGETDALGTTVGDGALTRRHEVTLANLEPDAVYEYIVSSTDQAGNRASSDPAGSEAWSRIRSFRTLDAEDTTAPVITRGPKLVVNNRGAVIEFDTNEPAIAELAYGSPSDLDTPAQEIVFESGLTRKHRLRIGHLSPGTRYVFRLKCRDAAGNTLVVGAPRRASAKVVLAAGADDGGDALQFTTEELADTAPPVITAGPTLVFRTADTAIIEWSTDEPADSFIDFGVSSLGSTVGDAEYTQDHSVFLTGLSAATGYTYQVRSTDFSGNAPVTSSQLSFTTMSSPDLTPPQLLVAPEVIYVADDQAIVTWTTDEATSPLVAYGESLPDRVLFDDLFATQHSAHLTGLAPSTVYQLQVTAADPSNNSIQSELVTVTTAAASGIRLPRISDVEVSSLSDVAAVVSWQSDVAANRFVFFGSGGTLDLAAGDTEFGNAHSVVLTNLEPSTTYQYSVESVDPAGNSSGRTSPGSFTTVGAPDTEPPPVPAAFTGLIGLQTARLSWTPSDASDLASYTVYRQINTTGFLPVAMGLAEASYTDEGLIFGFAYSYYVTAVDIQGNESTPSNEGGGAVSIRNAPSSVTPANTRTIGPWTTLTVSNAVASSRGGPLTYTFHVSTSELFDDIVASVSGIEEGTSQTEWSFTKELEAGRDYFWRARASDDLFDGPWGFPSFFVAAVGSPGDFDSNGAVDFDDFFAFVDVFGKSSGQAGYDASFDLDASGDVGFDDFFAFVDVFGVVYSTSRPAATAARMAWRPEPGLQVSTFFDGDDIVVDVATDVPAEGVAMALRFDPEAVAVIDAEATSTGLLRGLAPTDRLFGRIDDNPGEVTVFAHRLDGGVAASGSLLRVRLQPQPQHSVADTWLEIRELATSGTEGVRSLTAPLTFQVRLVPDHFALHNSYPNPFNPETTITYDIARSVDVRLTIYDVLGQRVRTLTDETLGAGRYRAVWNGLDGSGREAGSGTYFVALVAGEYRSVSKVLLLR